MPTKPLPKASEASESDPVAWRTADELLALANARNEWAHERLNETVCRWVQREALALGWDAVYFPLEYPSTTMRAGGVFFKRPPDEAH